MSDVLEFKGWLIKPGNYRTYQQVKRQLLHLFGRDVEITSWLDIYHWFEVSLSHSEDALKWFYPILQDNPPSSETGATPKQILLYRGAYVNKDAKSAPVSSNPTPVTYRGHTIEKPEQTPVEIKPNKKPRYYRGVIIEDE